MSARDFGSDTTRDYLIIGSPGAVTSLSAYSMICLMRPHNASRSGSFAARSAGGANVAQMILDGGKWFGGGDFGSGYTGFTAVANNWMWAGLSHAAGSSVYRWHHRDVTAAGSPVHGNSAFAVANPGAIATIRLGDGDDEAQCDIAVAAIYSGVLSDAQFNTAFSLNASDAFGLGPLAMWLGDSSNLETDKTGGGANRTSTFGTVGNSTDPPGYSYALATTVALAGAMTVGGITGAGTLTRKVNMTAAATIGGITGTGTLKRTVGLAGAAAVGGITGAGSMKRTVTLQGAGLVGGITGIGALKRTVHLAGAMTVGGITGRGTIGQDVVAGRRAIAVRAVRRAVVASSRNSARVVSSPRRPA